MPDSDGNKKLTLEAKDFLFFVPLFGSAVAISYDVGFFWGIDISYFTMFSISEHLTFSLQALPIVFVSLTWMFTGHISNRLGEASVSKAISSPIEKMSPTELKDTQVKLAAIRTRITKVSIIIFIGSATISGLLIYMKIYSVAALFMLGATLLLSATIFPRIVHRPPFPLAYLAGSALIVSFLIGLDVTHHLLERFGARHTIYLKAGSLNGRLIRSGDRGILFLEMPSKVLQLVPWTDINRIYSNN